MEGKNVTNEDFSEKMIDTIKEFDGALESAREKLDDAIEAAQKGDVKETVLLVDALGDFITDKGIALRLLMGMDLRPDLPLSMIAMKMNVSPEDFMRVAVESGILGGGRS